MKTIRLTEHWQERDSGQGSVSNPSQHHSNNNSTSNLHAQQITHVMPVSTSVSNVDRVGVSAPNATLAVVPINVTVNQSGVHQQQQATHHETGHDHYNNRKGFD